MVLLIKKVSISIFQVFSQLFKKVFLGLSIEISLEKIPVANIGIKAKLNLWINNAGVKAVK